MFPLVFSLLPKRDTATYNRFFTLLKDIASRHNLNFSTRVSLDFECASRNAATDTFPTAELYGCLFHYLKTIWRKTQEGGLQTAYKDIPDVTKLVRRAACLPLLPLNKVEDFWLSHRRIHQWNHYQTEGPRTNNHLEGWHNKLKKKVGITHRTIYKLIDDFKKEQAVNEVKIEQYSNGGHKH